MVAPLLIVLGLAVTTVGGVAAPARAAGHVIYDSIPATLAGDYPSVGFEVDMVNELGAMLGMVETGPRTQVDDATFVFSSWACQTGVWNLGTCQSEPGSTFEVEVVIAIYEVYEGAIGMKLGTTVDIVDVPYRPSASPLCVGPDAPEGFVGGWNDNGTCRNGVAFSHTFPFSPLLPPIPNPSVMTAAFNTESSGDAPHGSPGPYNFLGVALPMNNPPTVGSNPDPGQIYLNADSTGDTLEAYEVNGLASPMIRVTGEEIGLTNRPPDPSLPATGSAVDRIAASAGVVLTGIGVLALVLANRRRSALS